MGENNMIHISFLILFISIFLFLISDNFLTLLLIKNKKIKTNEYSYSLLEEGDEKILPLRKNIRLNSNLGTSGIPDYALNFILTRNDVYKAISLYKISSIFIEYSEIGENIKLKESLDSNNIDNSPKLTEREKCNSLYILLSILPILYLFLYSLIYNENISENPKAFIIFILFTSMSLIIGNFNILKYHTIEYAKELLALK